MQHNLQWKIISLIFQTVKKTIQQSFPLIPSTNWPKIEAFSP